MRNFFIITLLFFVQLCCCTVLKAGDVVSNEQSRIASLVGYFANGKIERIEILQIPANILTRTRITAQMLQKNFVYKLTIGDKRGNPYESGIVESLKSLSIAPTSNETDIRWGIIFYGVEGQPIESLFFDSTGKEINGEINGVVSHNKINFNSL